MNFSCNICSGSEVSRRETRGDGKQVLFCADCGMGVVENPPASTDAFYADGYYDRGSSEGLGYIDYAYTAEHGLLWVQLMVQALAPDNGSVLDVGCADGFLLHRLQGNYRRFGIEVNAAAQDRARARGVTLLGNDILTPGIGEGAGPFDVITSIATFEHVLDFRGAVAACMRQLAPGGLLLFEVPLISAKRDNKDWYHGSYEHIFYPTISGLERLFGSFEGLQFHGFESDIKGFSSSYIGAASYDAETFARVRVLLEAMRQPSLGGLDETATRLNLAYHVVHSFRPNGERVQALPTLLAIAHAHNLLKRLTQLWYEDAVRADAWRNTESVLGAGVQALGIAQTVLAGLRQELDQRQQHIGLQQQAMAAESAAFAESRAKCEATQRTEAERLAAEAAALNGLRQELDQRQQYIGLQQQAMAAESAAFADLRAKCEAAQRTEAERLVAEAAALNGLRQELDQRRQHVTEQQQAMPAEAAALILPVRVVAGLGRLSLRTLSGIRALLSGIILLLLLCLRPGVFDAAYYRQRYGFSRLVRLSPLFEFSFRGARALRDPSPHFAQQAYSATMPWTTRFPPILHALLYGGGVMPVEAVEAPRSPAPAEPARGGVMPVEAMEAPRSPAPAEPARGGVMPVEAVEAPRSPAPAEPAPPATPESRIAALWPALQADMRELMDVASALTPNDRLQGLLLQRCRPAPALHTASVLQRLMARLPARVEHLVVVPWLGIAGGSERVAQRLLRRLGEHYADGGLCVLAPDPEFDLDEAAQRRFGVHIVALNDLDRTLSGSARVELLDRVLVELRPATVHSINSDTAWQAFRDHGRHYARDCGLYGNIYSDFRYPDGTPIGIFWRYLPECLPHMAGIIADNRRVVSRAQECFGLVREQMSRFHVVRTPILGATEQERCRPYRPGCSRHSMWMSRIALEKRIDVLHEIALRCPERQFSIYGTAHENAVPDDYLDWTRQLPNVQYWGRFAELSTLPIDDCDSYIFTTSAEGMPIALMEATMLGLPTVAPDVGGIGEFIDADTGWLVRGPDDVDGYVAALAEIEADPAAAGRRVAAAQARLRERHSWKNFCCSLAAIPGYLQPRSR